MERITNKGYNIVFDVDVVGGVNIKNLYGANALSIFIQPPSIDELKKRLIGRNTDSLEKITERLAKAEYELTFAPKFDVIIINENLEKAISDTANTLRSFLNT